MDPLSLSGVSAAAPTAYTDQTKGAARTDGTEFADTLGSTIDGMQQLQSASDDLALRAVTGDLNDIHRATLAATRAQVTLELISTVRNKGVDAFNEIMRMQG